MKKLTLIVSVICVGCSAITFNLHDSHGGILWLIASGVFSISAEIKN